VVAAAARAQQVTLGLVSGNLKQGHLSANSEAYFQAWAAEHPMQGPALRRASFLSSDWKALGLSDNSLAASVGNMERTLVNITYRLSYLNETLAAQARCNAELAGGEALRAPRVDSLVGTVGTSLGSVGSFADEFGVPGCGASADARSTGSRSWRSRRWGTSGWHWRLR
jgi:hypothetical protein